MRRLLEGRLTAFGPWRGSPPKVIMGGTGDEITLLSEEVAWCSPRSSSPEHELP